jgi:hypothetical protein
MTFQFLCPQGHLLQGEEAHMGMQCQCPQCGTAFIIPTVDAAGDATVDELIAPLMSEEVDLPAQQGAAVPPDAPEEAAGALVEAASQLDVSELYGSELKSAAAAEAMLHIPCPNGHELETPLDMIGKRVKCPHCGAEFRLKREKSVEYIRQQEIVERRRARFWFQLSIIVASFVGVVVVAMILMAMFS